MLVAGVLRDLIADDSNIVTTTDAAAKFAAGSAVGKVATATTTPVEH